MRILKWHSSIFNLDKFIGEESRPEWSDGKVIGLNVLFMFEGDRIDPVNENDDVVRLIVPITESDPETLDNVFYMFIDLLTQALMDESIACVDINSLRDKAYLQYKKCYTNN